MILKAAESSTDAYDLAMTLAQESGLYLFYKADTSVEGQSRFANVQELLDSVKSYIEEVQGEYRNSMVEDGAVSDATQIPDSDLPKVTMADYLENVSLLSNVDVSDEESANKVALMTVHTAKGLEFPYVYVTGMEENLFPSGGWMLTPQEVEEERRLFYVALTRAKRVVTVSYAQTRMRNGKHESNGPSRFLREIAPQYLDHPLTRADMDSGRRDDDDDFDSPGFSWKRKPFGDGRSQPAMTGQRPTFGTRSTATISHTVIPSPKGASVSHTPVKPPVIDENFVPDPMSSFKAGDRIEHNRFGTGQILEIIGQVPDLKARVHFDKFGDKLLILKFAKMRHK
jgi:DNA helicase-2/ATP-dependent DNA helicase PcrA